MPGRILRRLHRIEDLLLAGLLGVLLLLAVLQIGLRVFFDTGLAWAEPVSRAGVLWLALLGAMGAARSRKHIAIDALPRLLPASMQRWLACVTNLCAAAICAMLAWYGWGMVLLEREAPTAFVADVPSWWPMLVFPLGFALIGLRFAIAAFADPHEEPA